MMFEALVVLVPFVLTVLLVWILKPIVFLKRDEQLLLETLSDKEVRNGPCTAFFLPVVNQASKRKAILLDEMEYVVVTDTLSGVQLVREGPELFFPGAYQSVANKSRKIVLGRDEYVKLRDAKTGDVEVKTGPSVVVPSATQTVSVGPAKGVNLLRQQYVRFVDTCTGVVRIERGENFLFPRAMETSHGVQEAVDVDDETAVLVLSKETGQQRLVTEKGLFYPGPYDEILEVRKLIRVEPHEVAIVQDNSGEYSFHNGSTSGKGTAFFLQPHHQLVTMMWGSGTSKEDLDRNIVRNVKSVAYKVPVTKIDLRAQYAFFEYNVRTADNVELVLEGTIFWQVVDVPMMIKATGDPKGDVWYHARSSLIQAISRVTLEEFMAGFDEVVAKSAPQSDEFYSERGLAVLNLEVTRYECAEKKTSVVLQEIIQETTNRINRMQQQRSENEVMREKMNGEIEVEKQRKALIEAKSDNDRVKAVIEGESDGLRLANCAESFLKVLGDSLPDESTRLNLFKFFEEQRNSTKCTEALASGRSTLFVTPQDMNLKLHVPAGSNAWTQV